MEEYYDYSRHKFCITFDFSNIGIASRKIAVNDHFESKVHVHDDKIAIYSFLYDTATKTIVARGTSVEREKKNFKGQQKDLFYAPNIFSELYKRTANDKIFLQEAIRALKQEVEYWKKELNSSDNMDFYYAYTLPANWDHEIIWSLFIKANLVQKNEAQGRLMFFSELEIAFRHVQTIQTMCFMETDHGDQFIICSLDFQNTVNVNLTLVSAQVPPITTADDKFAPRFLNETHFTIPSGAQKSLDNLTYQEVLSCQPFYGLSELYEKQYNLKKIEIDVLQSLTVDDIYKDLYASAETEFMDKLQFLLLGVTERKDRLMIIFYQDELKHNFESVVILKLIEKWSKTYSEEQVDSFELIEKYEKLSFLFEVQYRQDGLTDLVGNQMQEFNIRRDPIIISQDITTEEPESCYFVNIDISSKQTNATFTHLDVDNQVKKLEQIKCMKSLESFITRPDFNQKPVLHLTRRLKLHLEKTFGTYLRLYSNTVRQDKTGILLNDQDLELLPPLSSRTPSKGIKDLFVFSKPNLLEQLTGNVEMNDIFGLNDNSCNSDGNIMATSDPSYLFFFVITYLHYLNKLLEETLTSNFGNEWQDKDVWYAVSVDKYLLDNVFGSMKQLEKLFYASGILHNDDNLRKAKFSIHGEEILPAIQQKLKDLKFKMKSYFFVAQLYANHIQLSLHQVVKLATPGEVAASIVIQNRTIYIDDVYDALCKEIWKNLQSNCQIDYCPTHIEHNFGMYQAYENICQKLKLCVIALLERNKTNLDGMDSEIKLSTTNNKCACSINISFRNIIEVGLKSVLKNVATIIGSSLTNKEIFANYETNYIFMLGDPFQLSYGSSIHTVYTQMLQKEINNSIYLKEKDTQAFALIESVYMLLDPLTQIKPYLYEKFSKGTLCQVSSETYALRLPAILKKYNSFSRINRSGDVKNTLPSDSSYFIFIQRGKPFPLTDINIKVNTNHGRYENNEIIKVKDSGESKLKKYTVLDKNSQGSVYMIHSKDGHQPNPIVTIGCKFVNHNYSLELSVRVIGYDIDYNEKNYRDFVVLGEPLTLAYI
ncbi:hypothetical protein INT47_007859 [Mucor saturninus]|uniref:Uncharacterized protein n=1 Tax=Mucor saturninus TaxID=64648 RepID=A0A8H7V695_9FUNG|nr:hypothetical protein INT47_007859 [Mucor saturninus]